MKGFVFKLMLLLAAMLPGMAHAQINTDQVLRVGQNALYFEDYMLSIQYFNRVIEQKPYLAKPYFFRAIAKLNLEDYRGASEDATKAIELNPFLADAYEVRGVALQNMGRTKEAIEDYDRALEQIPENRHLMFNKAMAQVANDDLDSAKATLSEIINAHPGFENAYIGRAQVNLQSGDTLAATADLDKAISINKNVANAYVLRAAIAIEHPDRYESALEDMNEAIRLQPRYAGYFINRAFLRYSLDDYFGAMADYDYAITLDPLNTVAYFNRGLLRAQVGDNDKAISDFSQVLAIDPADVRARFNRAMLYASTQNYNAALGDINYVADALPTYSAPLFARSEIRMKMGDKKRAAADYDRAIALSKEELRRYDADLAAADLDAKSTASGTVKARANAKKAETPDEAPATDPTQLFANKFSALLTIDNKIDDSGEYNNKSIRGKVQDRNIVVETEPSFTVSYYSSPTELSPTTYYMPEISRINDTRQLRFLLQLTNAEPPLDEEQTISRHFESVEYYNSYLSTHTPRAIDYFARAMDFFTLRNYAAAIADLDTAIDMAPDFTLAYFMRAVCRERNLATATVDPDEARDLMGIGVHNPVTNALKQVTDDYEQVTRLSPRSPFAYFNLGNIYLKSNDLTSALSAYSRAIEIKPDFGEAYYNRGYVYFKLGNRNAGTDDLSRAGQLGILPSYNLLKRMSN